MYISKNLVWAYIYVFLDEVQNESDSTIFLLLSFLKERIHWLFNVFIFFLKCWFTSQRIKEGIYERERSAKFGKWLQLQNMLRNTVELDYNML